MNPFKSAYGRLKALFRHNALERDMDQEMRLHVDLLTEEYERAGLPSGEARRAARRRFGNLGRIKEEGRDIRAAGILDDLRRDLQYTGRVIQRAPLFSAVVVLSLAVGIGANTALFSVFDAIFLRDLPV